MYYLYLIGFTLASIFPRKISYFIAKAVAILHYYCSSKDRETVKYNLSEVIKNKKELHKKSKKVFINFAYYLADFFRYSKLNKDFIKKYVNLAGLDHLNKALSKGKGVIAVTAHLGNYELAGAVTSLLGYPLSAVALPHKDKRVNDFFNSQRRRTGVKVIATGSGVKGAISDLKNQRMLALLGDRDFSRSKTKMKMFSKYAYLPRGVAFFHKKTSAVIIPGFLIRERKYYYRLIFEEPIEFSESEKEDDNKIIEKYRPVLEKYIKKYPDQWYLFEKYWVDQ